MKYADAKAILKSLGYREDNFGHFKTACGTYRAKMQAHSARLERKRDGIWIKLDSAYYKDCTLSEKGLKFTKYTLPKASELEQRVQARRNQVQVEVQAHQEQAQTV